MTITNILFLGNPHESFKFLRNHFGNLCNPKITAFDEEADLKLVEKIKEYFLNNSINFDRHLIFFPTFSNSYAQATDELSKIAMKKVSLLLCNSLFSKSVIPEVTIPKDIISKIFIIWSMLSVFSFPSCENFQLKIRNTMKFTDKIEWKIVSDIGNYQNKKNYSARHGEIFPE